MRIEDRQAKIDRDKQLTLSPGFWDDNARATSILKELKIDEYWANLYQSTVSSVEDFAILFDFWKEGEAQEEEVKEAYDKAIKELDELEFKSTLNEPEDEMPGSNGDQLGRRRYGKPGLGGDAAAHVPYVWR